MQIAFMPRQPLPSCIAKGIAMDNMDRLAANVR
jgi:hypothetical protein